MEVCPRESRIVLQCIPRGNIEAVYPKVFIIHHISRLLSIRDYRKAFEECRRHKVDMNLLTDYNPHLFLEDVESFIQAVGDADMLNVFLSELRNEDISRGVFSGLDWPACRRDTCAVDAFPIVCAYSPSFS